MILVFVISISIRLSSKDFYILFLLPLNLKNFKSIIIYEKLNFFIHYRGLRTCICICIKENSI